MPIIGIIMGIGIPINGFMPIIGFMPIMPIMGFIPIIGIIDGIIEFIIIGFIELIIGIPIVFGIAFVMVRAQ
jgi:hypothetical protein